MRSLLVEMEWQINANVDHSENDIIFHTKIAESGGNIVMPNLMPVIQTGIILFTDMTSRTLRRETIETHRAILDASESHDSAADTMALHIAYNRMRMEEIADRRN